MRLYIPMNEDDVYADTSAYDDDKGGSQMIMIIRRNNDEHTTHQRKA